MADDADFSIDATPSLQDLATFLADELFNVNRIGRLETVMQNAHQKGATVANAAQIEALKSLPEKKKEIIDQAEDWLTIGMTFLMAKLVSHMLGVEVSTADIQRGAATPEESTVGRAVANVVKRGIEGDGGELTPGDEGSMRLVSMIAHLEIQSWFEGIVAEELSSLHGWLKAPEAVAQLGHDLIDALGLSRLSRMALRPLVSTVATTPLEWKVHKLYRPTLLAAGEILTAFKTGDYDAAEAAEELARLGYSDRRQDILLKNATKRLSVDDVQTLRRSGTLDRDYALQNLRDEGYDDTTAQYLVLAAEERRLQGVRDNSLPAITRAFVNREITESQFRTLIQAIVPDQSEQDFTAEFARTELELNVKHMSQGEVLDALDKLILPIAFYREWLRREGYPEEEATALELLYIAKRDAKANVEAERKRIAAEKAAEKAAKAKAAADKQAQLEAERALHARGSISDLRRAYARGLIPLSRLDEVLRAQYDADTVATLEQDADVDRAAYVAQQKAADDAKQRAARKNIDVGALEQAVLTHVLTVDQYADALTARGFDAGDVGILRATLAAKLKDQDDARAKRAQAARDAAVKRIDLARFEHLVRRGLRSLSDYDALLESLGYDDGSRAGMIDLLNAQIADDAKAQALRDAAARKPATKDLSLEQFRRAVLLGTRSEGDFQSFLARQGYTPDAQTVLLEELRRDVADADAARAKRAAAEAAKAVVDLPLSRVTAAARLGVITPDAYRERLTAAGYSDDDIAIEMELLLVEIADTQAARAKRDQLAAGTAPAKELSLQQLAAGVRAGTATLDQYRSAAAALYAPDDVDTLVATLQAETQTRVDARARHDAIAAELAARGLALEPLDAQVKAGTLSVDAYKAQLTAWGYAKDDGQLLAALLV